MAFSILAGFLSWSVIGFLLAKGSVTYNQSSSIGLAFIAFPTAAELDGHGKGWFGLFCFFLFISGIDSAFSYMEGIVTNIIDYYKCPRWKACLAVKIVGILFTIPFTSNAGWLLLDLVDHWISDYIIILVGLLQCVSVGWLFEYDTTAICSPQHKSSQRWMSLSYWISATVMVWVSIMALEGNRIIGNIIMFVLMMAGLFMSYKKSEMRFKSWYHEILLCGVDKLSMSITSLSKKDGSRSRWMYFFELWFALTVKFFIPVMMMWMLFTNIKSDLSNPYGGHSTEL